MVDIVKNRNFWLIFVGDAVLLSAAYYLSYLLRFDFYIPTTFKQSFTVGVIWIIPVKLTAFFLFNLYRGMYRYTGVHDSINLAKATLSSSAVFTLLFLYVLGYEGFSRGIIIIDMVMTFVLIGGFRMAIRLSMSSHLLELWTGRNAVTKQKLKRILIVGAGDAGETLLREINSNSHLPYKVVGFVDENLRKIHRKIHGISILGVPQELRTLADKHKVDELIIAIPSASAMQMRHLVNLCKSTDLPYKTVPGLSELIKGNLSIAALREVRYSDLLGRTPVTLDLDQVGGYIEGKVVMVTGAGGSIGSELCRQISKFRPRLLVLVERNESGLYDIDTELRTSINQLKTRTVLCAIQNRDRMRAVFSDFRPQVVFHAAAYKHVPMMETHPWEAIYNNILGSRFILEQCDVHNVERCVVVSTDKAVRPTNVMGATKRIVELISQCLAKKSSSTKYMAVRFGNVLGSAGSVLPLFKRQIEAGGPVTVTDPQVTRYFMTIPESCSLILQAGALGEGGEIFVLKMGTAIRIDDMARDLITLSGYEPETDIQILYTGLRPGEKLYEELITADEGILPTLHDDIMVLGANQCFDIGVLDESISKLIKLADKADVIGIKRELTTLVPEYKPSGENNHPEKEFYSSAKSEVSV